MRVGATSNDAMRVGAISFDAMRIGATSYEAMRMGATSCDAMRIGATQYARISASTKACTQNMRRARRTQLAERDTTG